LVLVGSSASPDGPALPGSCEAAVAGGGWAGVYFAFRLAEAGTRVCVFEASERIGGRTYSHDFLVGRRRDRFVLDLGAYRFTPDMHLPGDVILKVLKLPVACYEPSCLPANADFPPPFVFNYTAPLVRIVGPDGMPAGYVTAIEGMVDRIRRLGGQVFLGARLTDFAPAKSGGRARLVFGQQAVEAGTVLLNLPRQEILRLPSLRAATPARTVKMQECVKFDMPGDFFPPGQKFDLGRSLTKAYAFYDEAWWHTRLNKTEGQWPANAFIPTNTSLGIPVGIHFNDGPVRCDAPALGCRGFLQVFYSPSGESFYEDLRPSPWQPLGVVKAGADAGGRLRQLHAAIMEATAELFSAAGAEPPQEPPSLLAVGVWDRQGQGYTAPTKVYYSKSASTPGGPDPLERACGVPGLSEEEYRRSVLQPLGPGGAGPLVANNDFVAAETERLYGDWAEESLLQAERGLRLLGHGRPAWLDASYYEAKVLGGLEGVAPPPAAAAVPVVV